MPKTADGQPSSFHRVTKQTKTQLVRFILSLLKMIVLSHLKDCKLRQCIPIKAGCDCILLPAVHRTARFPSLFKRRSTGSSQACFELAVGHAGPQRSFWSRYHAPGIYGSGKKDGSSYFSGLGPGLSRGSSSPDTLQAHVLYCGKQRVKNTLSWCRPGRICLVVSRISNFQQMVCDKCGIRVQERMPHAWRRRPASSACQHPRSSLPRALPPSSSTDLELSARCHYSRRLPAAVRNQTNSADPRRSHGSESPSAAVSTGLPRTTMQVVEDTNKQLPRTSSQAQLLTKLAHGHAVDNQACELLRSAAVSKCREVRDKPLMKLP